MQNFIVPGRRWRCTIILILLALPSALLAAASLLTPLFLIPLALLALIFGRILWNVIRSLASPPVALNWNGQALTIGPLHDHASFEIETAHWVFSDGWRIVIHGVHPLPRFNAGHVRCNGRELTIDGFLGTMPKDLSDTLRVLGAEKRWLWRYIPIWMFADI